MNTFELLWVSSEKEEPNYEFYKGEVAGGNRCGSDLVNASARYSASSSRPTGFAERRQ